jgi:hypothetical protein
MLRTRWELVWLVHRCLSGVLLLLMLLLLWWW